MKSDTEVSGAARGAFAGRLFGPDLPGAGVLAECRWGAGVVYLRCGERRIDVAVARLYIEAAGFNHGQTRVSWAGEGGDYALFLEHGAAQAFAAAAPAELALGLRAAGQTRRGLEHRFRLGWAVLGGVLAAPLLALMVFLAKADDIADWVAEHVPPEFEAQLGDGVLQQTRAQSKLSDDSPAAKTVRGIGERLVPGSRHHYRWFVADNPEINAFAAPGGVVVVNAGLIAAVDNGEELAGVLAHEVSHVELRHSVKAAVKMLGLRALWSLALGDYSGTLAGEAAAQLTGLKFSRDAEAQADLEGLHRLAAAGISPAGMPSFFAKLAEKEGAAKLPALLSTHPLSEDRRERLQTELAALPKRDYPPLPFQK
ncbi:M48 family metallopeptidase [Methylococcus sp. EFPC2]|uniref:M48 family metallopeptidase n=1 Tax=Methylococcus sp. EFPC2 TaxID=2812648 RepID=UPI00196703DB|nr:M48 family metallopeptidase [Methylococcus sp. EFPC2]QSA97280.1 M48 family metallopeptidase [Methylococcus sp. EFPC2]